MKSMYVITLTITDSKTATITPVLVTLSKEEAENKVRNEPIRKGHSYSITETQYYDRPIKTNEGIKCKLIDRKGFFKEFTLRELIPVFKIADFKPNISYMSEPNFEISEQTCKELEFYYDYSENGVAIYNER